MRRDDTKTCFQQVDIILRDGPRKATGPQAKALAPDYVTVRRFPEELPERYDPHSTYVLYPSEVQESLGCAFPPDF